MLFVNASSVWQPQLSAADLVIILIYSVAVILEVVADVQKAKWVRAGRPGVFCSSGVWHWSRHPNYFGEILMWWCAWAFAYFSGSGFTDVLWWACAISPLFTMHILLNTPATGVVQANGQNLKRYYDK